MTIFQVASRNSSCRVCTWTGVCQSPHADLSRFQLCRGLLRFTWIHSFLTCPLHCVCLGRLTRMRANDSSAGTAGSIGRVECRMPGMFFTWLPRLCGEEADASFLEAGTFERGTCEGSEGFNSSMSAVALEGQHSREGFPKQGQTSGGSQISIRGHVLGEEVPCHCSR